ncbi:unnamed protein product [Calicophoron daubneyi]|uniref:Uncharacterized protein n=1 Tax=Calicophoron daubneyi TaxID=300641 RepID=A0AAV2TGH1_CALDB
MEIDNQRLIKRIDQLDSLLGIRYSGSSSVDTVNRSHRTTIGATDSCLRKCCPVAKDMSEISQQMKVGNNLLSNLQEQIGHLKEKDTSKIVYYPYPSFERKLEKCDDRAPETDQSQQSTQSAVAKYIVQDVETPHTFRSPVIPDVDVGNSADVFEDMSENSDGTRTILITKLHDRSIQTSERYQNLPAEPDSGFGNSFQVNSHAHLFSSSTAPRVLQKLSPSVENEMLTSNRYVQLRLANQLHIFKANQLAVCRM